MRRAIVAGILAIGFCSGAMAQCKPGEVWGDVGCRPKAEPSPLVRAVKHLQPDHSLRKKKKKPKPAAAEASPRQ